MSIHRLFNPHRLAAAALAGFLLLFAVPFAHADDEADKSWLVQWVERTISTPDRKISLGRIDGALSSDVRIDRITIADRQGVWLTIDGAHLVWSRTSLLRGLLSIDKLEASGITVARLPASPAAPDPNASEAIKVPELPVSVSLKALDVPEIHLLPPVAGSDMTFAVAASGSLDGNGLKAHVDAHRKGDADSHIRFDADYASAKATLGLDLDYGEPHGGLLAHALGLPGEPALGVTLRGNGPLAHYAADLALNVNGQPVLGGRTTIERTSDAYALVSDLSGSLESLATGVGTDYFRGQSHLGLALHRFDDGTIGLDRFTLQGGVLKVDASGHLASDGFPTRLKLDATLAGTTGPVHLPGSDATIRGGALSLAFGDGNWTGTLALDALGGAAVEAQRIAVRANGTASDLADALKRSVAFDVSGTATGLSAPDPKLASAVAGDAALTLSGDWHTGQPLNLRSAHVTLGGETFDASGTVDGATIAGKVRLASAHLARYAGLAGLPLDGSAELSLTGSLAALTGAFDVTTSGHATSVLSGTGPLATLLKGQTQVSGRITRDVSGTHVDKLRLANAQVSLAADGSIDRTTVDATVTANLADAATLDSRIRGRVDAALRIVGPLDEAKLAASISGPALRLGQHRLDGARVTLDGTGGTDHIDATVTLAGNLDAAPLNGRAGISVAADGGKSLKGLSFTLRRASLAGDLALDAKGLIAGHMTAHVPDLAEIAPLLLVDGHGAIDADIALTNTNGRQDGQIALHAADVAIAGVNLRKTDANLSLSDLFGTPAATGSASLSAAKFNGFAIDTATLAFTPVAPAGATRIAADARLSTGPVHVAGVLTKAADGFDLTVSEARATVRGQAISLRHPARLERRGGDFRLEAATIALPHAGEITVAGTVGAALAADLTLRQVPLSLADIAAPDLGATGTLSGSLHLSGTTEAPSVRFNVTGSKLSAAAARKAGLTGFDVRAEGNGPLLRPTITARVSDGRQTTLTATGAIPLGDGTMALSVKGTTSLALANFALRDRGGRADGRIDVDMTVAGTLAAPSARGRITLTGGSIADPETGMRLNGMSARLALDGDRLRIEQASATTGTSGTVSASGSLSIGKSFDADLAIRLAAARISAAPIAEAVIDGALTVRGPLMQQPTIAGALTVSRAEISIPERFATNVAALNVKTVGAPKAVKETNARAFRKTKAQRGHAAPAADAALDITISVPSRLFVRGRGVDAELSGTIRIAGMLSAPQPTGALTLRRGSLDVAGKHVQFDSGTVTLLGDLDPMIDFRLSSTGNGVTVTIAITGSASDPALVLSSSPDLPQDEILSQFLFGHNVADLSSTQLILLASSAAQLAGGSSGPGLLGSIRNATGLDSFGTTTDRNGNVALQAGRYIGERMYLGVTTGVNGSANATLNIDVTKDLKVQFEAGQTENKGGLVFQKDY